MTFVLVIWQSGRASHAADAADAFHCLEGYRVPHQPRRVRPRVLARVFARSVADSRNIALDDRFAFTLCSVVLRRLSISSQRLGTAYLWLGLLLRE